MSHATDGLGRSAGAAVLPSLPNYSAVLPSPPNCSAVRPRPPRDDLVTEDDRHLPLLGLARNGFESRLLGSFGAGAGDVALQPAHQVKKTEDCERPQDQDEQEEDLVGGHC